MEKNKKSIFETLNSINVNEHTEDKNGLTYLSWAWAWAEVKKLYPDANYIIYEREGQNGPINYFTDGKTCWVKTGVVINDLEHIEYLPVMNYKNQSIPLNNVTSFDVNKAIQRSLTKALARHGLGLYIYAGEDLPEEEEKENDLQRRKEAIKKALALNEEVIKYGVDLNDEKDIKYIAEHNNGKFKLSEMNENELNNYIKVVSGIIENKKRKVG